ncbi:cathelicidin-2-like [Tachyglossus aculeatus]|uniref:cathelicidin-2-like n=1 Tax=Tachyglossus aculeatus TaxID=9261 RepID=UPI0018F4AD48|nr:cathelicidin-2-like [Tachyglossus aculeatus]
MTTGVWRVLLLVSVAAALTPARGLSHREAVNLALDAYNRGPDVTRAFRVFGSVPRPRADPSPTTIPLNFTVKETVCFKREGLNPDKCAFKDHGLVRDCTGSVSTAQEPPAVTISCEGPIRTKRFLFSIIRAGIKLGRSIVHLIKRNRRQEH